MRFEKNDGGRSKYFKGKSGDCVCRAIAIATNKDYLEVYNELNKLAKNEKTKNHYENKRSSARNGVFKETWKLYLEQLGYKRVPTMFIGSGCQVRIEDFADKKGTYIVSVARHLTCIIDGVINDTWNCSDSKTCVYGYYKIV